MSRHPNRCHVCGSNYGHHRGCKLADLSLKPEQESAIRSDPGNVSEFDVECLLHEIDYLRTELKESQWLTKNAVDELAALKELHANCETEISLRVSAIQGKNGEIAALKDEILRLRKELEYVEQKICKWAGITHGSVDWAELQVLHSRLHSKGCQPC